MSVTEDTAEVFNLVRAIRPLLAGKKPEVMGAVLADLLAQWLAGHVKLGDPKGTRKAREQMLKMHLVTVRALIEPNYKMSVEPQIKRNTQ